MTAAAEPLVADVLLAHHPLLTALPFFVPALIVVGLIAVIIVRDRREGAREGEDPSGEAVPPQRSVRKEPS